MSFTLCAAGWQYLYTNTYSTLESLSKRGADLIGGHQVTTSPLLRDELVSTAGIAQSA